MNKLSTIAGGLVLIAFCVVMGMVSVVYGSWVDDKLIRIVLLPGVLVLIFLFFADKTKLFLLLILMRVTIDPFIEATRVGPLTAGALMNALVLLIAFLLFVERPRTVSRIVIPMWLPLVLVMMFEAARAPDRLQGLRTFLGYLTSIAVFTVPFYVKQCQKDMGFCIRLLLLSSVAPAFYAFVDFAHGGMGGENGNRVASLFPHPNIFAFFLVVVISLTFFMLKSKVLRPPPWQRWLLAAYIAVLLVDLVLTKTRSAWAACGVVFIVYGLMFERRYLVYIAVGTVAALFIPAVQDRLMDLNAAPVYWSYTSTQNSYEWRQSIWKSGLSWMSLSALPLGYGLQSFAYYSTEFFQQAGGTHWGAHNVYVQWLFEAGIVGLLCAAWLFYRVLSLLKMGMRDDKLGTVIVITIVLEYLVVSYSDNMLEYLAFNWYFWFVVGTSCSIVVARQAQTKSALLTDPAHGGTVRQLLP